MMGWGLAGTGNSSAAVAAVVAVVAPGGGGGGTKWKRKNGVGLFENGVKTKEKHDEWGKNGKKKFRVGYTW